MRRGHFRICRISNKALQRLTAKGSIPGGGTLQGGFLVVLLFLYLDLYFFLYSAILISMSPEEKSLLERTYKMAEENNEILRSIRNSTRWSNAFKIIYWTVILGFSFGAYYFIQPYLDTLMGISGQVKDSVNGVNSVTSTIRDLIN